MSALQQLLLAGGGQSSFGLDGYVTTMWGAYSISKLLSSSTSALVAVNTTSSASATIGFSGNSLDTAALATLAGANTCVVSEFLNQEGTSARKFAQATSANRPRIVNAGVYDGKLVFDGTNDTMLSGAASGTPQGFTVFMRGTQRTTVTQIVLEHSPNYNSNDACIVYYDVGALSVGVHRITGSGVYRSDYTGAFINANVQAYAMSGAAGGGAANARMFINGVLQSRTGNGDSGVVSASNMGSFAWNLASRNQASTFAALDLHTLLIYESILSNGDITAISGIVAALP